MRRIVTMLLWAGPVMAQGALPEMPISKVERGENVRPRASVRDWRPSVATMALTGAVTFDGLTTRRNVGWGYHEADPITRPLIGRRPTMGRMTVFGTGEVVAGEWLAHRYRWGRWVEWGLVGVHVGAGAWNLTRSRSGRR